MYLYMIMSESDPETVFDILAPKFNIDKSQKQILEYATKLSRIGVKLNYYSNGKNKGIVS